MTKRDAKMILAVAVTAIGNGVGGKTGAAVGRYVGGSTGATLERVTGGAGRGGG